MKAQTFTLGLRRFAWSQSAETTGSLIDKVCAEDVACDAAAAEDMQDMDPGSLYPEWDETDHECSGFFCNQGKEINK